MKQVIVMRTDLNMRKGKMVVQAAHAVLACCIGSNITIRIHSPGGEINADNQVKFNKWVADGMTKICLKGKDEAHIKELHKAAQDAGIAAYTVTDAGKTEFNGIPTITCLAIGPDHDEAIDKITGELELL